MTNRLLAAALTLGLPLAAHAQTGPTGDIARGAEPVVEGDWEITLGAGALLRPEYLGADTYDVMPLPFVDVRFRDLAFLSARDGLGVNVYRDENWRIGPVLRWDFGRDQDDADALEGMGDVDGALEIGGFVYYSVRPFTLGVEARQALGGHEGFVADVSATWAQPIGERLIASLGPRLTLASDDYMQSYFGVSDTQSARSGYDRFDAGGGLRDVALAGSLIWRVTDAWALTTFAEYARLFGDAADSPLVDEAGDPNQFSVGVALTWRFGL